MNLVGNVSKVAICPICNGFVLACHVDSLSKKTEKDFTQFTNEGFVVKIETVDETKSREYSFYGDCIKEIKKLK